MRSTMMARLLLLAVAMATGASGCARHDQPIDPADIPDEPLPGGTLTVAIQADGLSLDPHAVTDAPSMRLIENMYGTLLRYGDDYGEVESYLAESYQASADRRTYTFALRPDVRFHATGRPLTSADVEYSIRRIIDHRVRADQFEPVDSISTPDAHTVTFHLSRPAPAFPTYLAYPMNVIVDRDVVEANDGSLSRSDAGTGPFRLVEWRRDRHLILERYEAYHLEGLPYLDRLVFRPIPDETARTTALRTGEVHITLDVPGKDRVILEDAPHVELASVPGTFWEYVGINARREPFDDHRVRQAMAWAVDRSMVSRFVTFSRARVLTGGFLPTSHWAYTELEVYPARDTDRARELLRAAGLADGFRAVIRVGSAFPYQVAAAQVVKQNLEDVGIVTEILAEESAVFFDALGRSDFDLTVVGWLGFVDPDEWFYNIFHSAGRWNQQGYSNPRVDRLLEEGRVETDPGARKGIYHRVQEKVVRDAPVVLLYLNDQTSAYLDTVQGFRVHATATTLSLRETWLVR